MFVKGAMQARALVAGSENKVREGEGWAKNPTPQARRLRSIYALEIQERFFRQIFLECSFQQCKIYAAKKFLFSKSRFCSAKLPLQGPSPRHAAPEVSYSQNVLLLTSTSCSPR